MLIIVWNCYHCIKQPVFQPDEILQLRYILHLINSIVKNIFDETLNKLNNKKKLIKTPAKKKIKNIPALKIFQFDLILILQ